jgi:hypothetical protein
MLPLLLNAAQLVLGKVIQNSSKIEKEAGVTRQVVERVLNAVGSSLENNPEQFSAIAKELDSARAFAVSTQVQGNVLVETLRGLVRPIITYVAMSWYVYARFNEIQLTAEDYAIIGGIIAFWFGFRPFEKRLLQR